MWLRSFPVIWFFFSAFNLDYFSNICVLYLLYRRYFFLYTFDDKDVLFFSFFFHVPFINDFVVFFLTKNLFLEAVFLSSQITWKRKGKKTSVTQRTDGHCVCVCVLPTPFAPHLPSRRENTCKRPAWAALVIIQQLSQLRGKVLYILSRSLSKWVARLCLPIEEEKEKKKKLVIKPSVNKPMLSLSLSHHHFLKERGKKWREK